MRDRHVHPTSHIIARARQQIRTVRAPLHLPHRVLVPREVRLARPAHRWVLRRVRPELHHTAVPDLDRLVDARAREQPRAVLVPVDAQDLGAGRGHGERRGGERVCEGVCGARGEARCAKVEDLERAVGGAGREDVGLVWGEEGLVDTGCMRL